MVGLHGPALDLPPNRLRTFLMVARRQSFTRAADELHLTQPAVSMHIRKLERTLGGTLFDQIGRRVHLTATGRALYAYAERVLALEDDFRAALADLDDVCQGPFSIGTSTTIGISLLPDLLRAFTAAHPLVTLHVRIGMGDEIVAELLDGQLDVGLVTGAIEDERIEAEQITEDELVLIVPPGHRWATVASIAPHDLLGEPLLVPGQGSWNRTLIARQLAEHGVTPEVVAESNSHIAIARLVEAGVGAAIISRLAVADELTNGRLRATRLRDVDLRRPVYFAMHRGKHPSPAMRAFRALVIEAMERATDPMEAANGATAVRSASRGKVAPRR
ncbi:MAG: LysR family transcriptional regulator [Chloroflexi bacterium]|nr:LysR family transcriptional regulator [Chloroflexota bacterium]